MRCKTGWLALACVILSCAAPKPKGFVMLDQPLRPPPAPDGMLDYAPLPFDGPLPGNPYTGWVVWGKDPDFSENSQPWSMLYARVLWREIEPERDRLEWETFERDWHFAAATGNRKIVLRVVMDNPVAYDPSGARPTHRDIPDWLYHAIGGKGTAYNTTEIGRGFSPDYTNATLLARHKRLVEALAARYDRDPRVAFVQVGALGHWGELHTWPPGSGEFPGYATVEKYVRHYTAVFRNTKILLRRPLAVQAGVTGLGLYNDVIGDTAQTDAWLAWIANGYRSEWEQAFHPALPHNWWHAGCSGGEFSSWPPPAVAHYLSDDAFPSTLDQIVRSHTSWIGPSMPGKIPAAQAAALQEKIDRVLATMGYRFALTRVRYDTQAARKDRVTIALTLENRGVAPMYNRWPVEVALLDAAGAPVHSITLDRLDTRAWLPGVHAVEAVLDLPAGLAPGDYSIAFSIRNPDAYDTHGVDLAIDRRYGRPDCRFVLGPLSVR